ncbi:unnamed protein product [Tenebrio molitor]|nr:unnamed protein product [Tenebrio molitor]
MEHKYKNRMEKYRIKIRQDPEKWKEHLEKEKVRDKNRRERMKVLLHQNVDMLSAKRKNDRLRQTKCRERLKALKSGRSVEDNLLQCSGGINENNRVVGEEIETIIKNVFQSDLINNPVLDKSEKLLAKTKTNNKGQHMTISLDEAYTEFKQYSEMNNSSVDFYELRPKTVDLLSDTPSNVCICNFLC